MPFLLLFLLIPSFVSAADPYRFEVKTIAEDFARPMGMDLGPDGSIYLIELQGKVNRIHPTTGKLKLKFSENKKMDFSASLSIPTSSKTTTSSFSIHQQILSDSESAVLQSKRRLSSMRKRSLNGILNAVNVATTGAC